jgi:hypothetical protein
MSEQPQRSKTLREVELEVEAEGREWMRQRLEEKLEQQAEQEGRVFPPQPKKGTTPAQPKAGTGNRVRSR